MNSTCSSDISFYLGDFFQIPPVRAIPMYVTVLDNYIFKKPSQPAGPTDIGQRFFASFKLFRLDKQYRSLDPVHSANLESLRCLDPKIFPFNHSLLAHYKTFSSADVLADPEWLLAPTVVLFNQ